MREHGNCPTFRLDSALTYMRLDKYFKLAIDKKASDLHVVGGEIPALRIAGQLTFIDDHIIVPAEMVAMVAELLTKPQFERLQTERELDTAANFGGWRFRVNLHFQRATMGLSARLVPELIPNPEDIGFTETIYNLATLNSGLVLVTGPSGSGKSTTLAAMLELINRERSARIITIEDPIEFVYQNKKKHDYPARGRD